MKTFAPRSASCTRPREVARVGVPDQPGFALIEIRQPAFVQHAFTVAGHDVARAAAQQDAGNGHTRGARARDDDPQPLQLLPRQAQGVEQGGQHHDGGAVLVVVKHRDVQLRLEFALDVEAARGGDVFQVDAAEAHGQVLHGRDDLLRVLGPQADRVGVNAGEFLEEHRLAFHDRHGGFGADVAQAQHGGAIADDGDGVAFDGKLPGLARLGGNGFAHARHARACRPSRARRA